MNFGQGVRVTKFKGIPLHAEKVKVDNGVRDYCMKKETRVEGPWEFGSAPVRVNNKKDWEEIFAKAKSGDYDSIPGEIKIKHWSNL